MPARVWPVMRVTAALTRLADTAVGLAVRHLLRDAAAQRRPQSRPIRSGPRQGSGYFVLALGKMGANELNYSSDIDLIVFYDIAAATAAPGTELAPFYVRLTRRLVKLLAERTADGYVFRTDLRLRPDPASTQIAVSTAAALDYYESVGQTWERAALIKARPCAGDIAAGKALLAAIAPFIWRKHIDFAAVTDIHAMKRQIHAYRGHGEIDVEGHNIKLGRGGIREIEFFAQTQQLILGGRHPELRVPQTLGALAALAAGRLDRRARLRRAGRRLPVPASGREPVADGGGRADPDAAVRSRGARILRPLRRLCRPRCVRGCAARAFAQRAAQLRQPVRARAAGRAAAAGLLFPARRRPPRDPRRGWPRWASGNPPRCRRGCGTGCPAALPRCAAASPARSSPSSFRSC